MLQLMLLPPELGEVSMAEAWPVTVEKAFVVVARSWADDGEDCGRGRRGSGAVRLMVCSSPRSPWSSSSSSAHQ
jgi:hypothetical protein